MNESLKSFVMLSVDEYNRLKSLSERPDQKEPSDLLLSEVVKLFKTIADLMEEKVPASPLRDGVLNQLRTVNDDYVKLLWKSALKSNP